MYGSTVFKKELTAVRPAQRLSFGGGVLGWSIVQGSLVMVGLARVRD